MDMDQIEETKIQKMSIADQKNSSLIEESDYDPRNFTHLVKEGKFDELKELIRRKPYKLEINMPIEAIRTGRIDILEWLVENKCPIYETTCWAAALMNRLDIIKYLKNKGCSWDASTCTIAAEEGFLELLEWLRFPATRETKEEKSWGVCPWDEQTCYRAALGGRIDILWWMRNSAIHTKENKFGYTQGSEVCPWDKNVTNAACGGKYFILLKWLFENNCPISGWMYRSTCAEDFWIYSVQPLILSRYKPYLFSPDKYPVNYDVTKDPESCLIDSEQKFFLEIRNEFEVSEKKKTVEEAWETLKIFKERGIYTKN